MKRENVYKPVTYTQQYILFMNVIIIFNNNSNYNNSYNNNNKVTNKMAIEASFQQE